MDVFRILILILFAVAGCAGSEKEAESAAPEAPLETLERQVKEMRVAVESYCECGDDSCREASMAKLGRAMQRQVDALAKLDESHPMPEGLALQLRDLSERTVQCEVPTDKLQVEIPAKLRRIAAKRMAEYADEARQNAERSQREYAIKKEKSCEAGATKACVLLAEMYQDGRDVERDWPRALELYERACDLGDARICLALAEAYLEGQGVEKDWERTLELSHKACDHGHSYTCSSLADAYERGTGVERDRALAATLRDKAKRAALDEAKKAGVLKLIQDGQTAPPPPGDED